MALLFVVGQLAVWAPASEIVALDLSGNSLQVVQDRLTAMKAMIPGTRVRLVQASILEVARVKDIGSFDYIEVPKWSVLLHSLRRG